MREILTVEELNRRIKELLENGFPFLWVEGEVSNLSRPASGHLYFTLKDENAQIRAVIFRTSLLKGALPFALENGMKIILGGRLNVYTPRGEYQLIAEVVEPLGIGALQKAFEQLKARLEQEGLFFPHFKKPLPFLPQRIGVITSLSGAVIRDILHITYRRFPSVDILIAPVRVQGSEAASEIIAALEAMETHGKVDVIIIARGGGSLEDLAPFNDEGLARAIFRCSIPVISAIGHETDYTIADFVADLRAPTPSAAAELVVPVRQDLCYTLQNLLHRLKRQIFSIIDSHRGYLTKLRERLVDPRRKIADLRLFLDSRLNYLQALMKQRMSSLREGLMSAKFRLSHQNPIRRLEQEKTYLIQLEGAFKRAWTSGLEERKKRLAALLIMLDTLNPLGVLKRGYSITRLLPEQTIVTDTASLRGGKAVSVTLARGSFLAEVKEIYREDNYGERKV